MSTSWWNRGLWFAGLCGIAAVLAGCSSAPTNEPVFSDSPTAAVGSAPVAPPAASVERAGPAATAPGGTRFRVGDLVTVTYSGIEPPPAPNEERIREDGTITLPMIGSVLAKSKTGGELQKEIQDRYVPKYYNRLVVTVKSLDSFYYVGGEVKQPGRQPWVGELSVSQAIQTCGDFTDFANKKNVQLIRPDGTSVTVNCVKALKDPKLDPKVMPGDTIKVHRRWW